MAEPVVTDLSSFLTASSPLSCFSTTIDFARTPLPEYTPHFALLIRNLLTPTECDQLLTLAQSTTNPPSTWAPAQVNVGHGKQRMILEARNCGRIIWDDITIAERLMARVRPHLPDRIVTLKDNACVTGNGAVRKGVVWRMTRMNERLRFLKYTSGMYFREHCDGSYVTPDGKEVSFLTVHIYLNGDGEAKTECTDEANGASNHSSHTEQGKDAAAHGAADDAAASAAYGEDQPLRGGATRFFSLHDPPKFYDVTPEKGACLVFQHRGLLHSGEEVESGLKYTVRSDIMYQRVEG